MPKEKMPPPDTTGEVPTWFMTYSDVITLLMTFFILLLTFASQEPEQFERMKVSMFGSGGSDGVAGNKEDTIDRESVLHRFRPEMSRLTQQGTETPPSHVDASRDGLNEGLKALEEESGLAESKRLSFAASRNSMLLPDGELTQTGRKFVSDVSKQLRNFPMKLEISVPEKADLTSAVRMAYAMTYEYGVKLGNVSVATQQESRGNKIKFTLIREQ